MQREQTVWRKWGFLTAAMSWLRAHLTRSNTPSVKMREDKNGCGGRARKRVDAMSVFCHGIAFSFSRQAEEAALNG